MTAVMVGSECWDRHKRWCVQPCGDTCRAVHRHTLFVVRLCQYWSCMQIPPPGFVCFVHLFLSALGIRHHTLRSLHI